MGCKPITEEGKCCPTRFDCPNLSDRDGNKCHLNGKSYDINESVPNEEVESSSCTVSCRCSKFGDDDVPHFVCASYDCPEFINNSDDDNEDEADDCIRQDSKNSCCSTGRVCGKEKAKLANCYLDGSMHFEGQRMYPEKDSCYACICSKKFDNSTIVGNEDCWEINCGLQIHYARQLQQGCIPVYYGKDGCCPIAWNCPDEKVKIIPNAKSISNDDDNLKCKFGKHSMNLGDSVLTDDKCITCKCLVPPSAQCVQDLFC